MHTRADCYLAAIKLGFDDTAVALARPGGAADAKRATVEFGQHVTVIGVVTLLFVPVLRRPAQLAIPAVAALSDQQGSSWPWVG